MSFQITLGGLAGASQALDVIGNNIANSNTVGFKRASTPFADLYASALGGSTAQGVTSLQPVQQFTQGDISRSDNPLDVAIGGTGLFQLSSGSGETLYSRDGQFQKKAVTSGGTITNYLVNADGYYLNGWANGVSTATAPAPLKLTSFSTSEATPTMASKATANVSQQVNLASGSAPPATATFDPKDATSYNYVSHATIYDNTNGKHDLATYFVKAPASNTWNVYSRLDGVAPSEEAGGPRQMTFSTLGLPTSQNPFTSTFTGIPNATISPLSIDLTKSTQYAGNFGLSNSSQDGYAKGFMTGVAIGSDGKVVESYSNGQTNTVGTIALARFNNFNGLQSRGDNMWASTPSAGSLTLDVPGSRNCPAVLNSQSIENSTVNATSELVDMITQQRNYQANSQAIKTQDALLQSLISLK